MEKHTAQELYDSLQRISTEKLDAPYRLLLIAFQFIGMAADRERGASEMQYNQAMVHIKQATFWLKDIEAEWEGSGQTPIHKRSFT